MTKIVKKHDKRVPFVIKLLGIFLAGLIGVISGSYAYNVLGYQFLVVRSTILFVAGILSFILAYGLWKGTKWSWGLGILIALTLIVTTLISFNATNLFIGLLLFCGLTQGSTREYFGLMAQSSIEYLVMYSWALVLIIVSVGIILTYFIATPGQIVSSSCNFTDGVYCNDIVVFNTAQNPNSVTVAVEINNPNNFAILEPSIYAYSQNQNSSVFSCVPPGKLAPGGSALCVASLPFKSSYGSLVEGYIYIKTSTCTSLSCSTPLQETYVGSFSGHVQQSSNPVSYEFTFLPSAYDPVIGSADQLTATISLFGLPLKGASVNFSVNNSAYTLTNLAATGSQGYSTVTLRGSTVGSVAVTASYLGISNTIVINYVAAGTTTSSVLTSTSTASTTSVTSTSSTEATTSTSTISQTEEQLVMSMTPSNAANYWTICTNYYLPGTVQKINSCVGNTVGFGGSYNDIPVPSGTTITSICTGYTSNTGGYGFVGWLPSSNGLAYNGYYCVYNKNISVTQNYYIQGNYQTTSTNGQNAVLQIKMSPGNALKTWNLSVGYIPPGFSGDQYLIAGTPLDSATNTTNVPVGSILDSVCTSSQSVGAPYSFVGFNGNYVSNTPCATGLDIPINGVFNVNASYKAYDSQQKEKQYTTITLSMNPSAAAPNWGVCIYFALAFDKHDNVQQCVGDLNGFSAISNTFNVVQNDTINYICAYNNSNGPGNYGFTGWSGNFQSSSSCDYGLDIPVNVPYTIQGNFNTVTTYPVQLSITPANAANYWQACFDYVQSGSSSDSPQECVGTGPANFVGSSNTIYVPSGSTINVACASYSSSNGGYTFNSWMGNVPSSSCNYALDYKLNGAISMIANFTTGGSSTTSTTTTTGTTTSTTSAPTTTSTSVTTTSTIPLQYALTMACSGPVYSNCGINPVAGVQYDYPQGSTVAISAPATTASTSSCSSGSAAFEGWSGVGGGYTGNALATNIVISNNIEETASYICD